MKPEIQTRDRPVPTSPILPLVGVAHRRAEAPAPTPLITWADWFIVAGFLAVMAGLGAIVWHGYQVGAL